MNIRVTTQLYDELGPITEEVACAITAYFDDGKVGIDTTLSVDGIHEGSPVRIVVRRYNDDVLAETLDKRIVLTAEGEAAF